MPQPCWALALLTPNFLHVRPSSRCARCLLFVVHDAGMVNFELLGTGRVVKAGDRLSMAETLELLQAQAGDRPLYPVVLWKRDGQGEFVLKDSVTPTDVLQNLFLGGNLIHTEEQVFQKEEEDMVVPVPLGAGRVLMKPLQYATAEDMSASVRWETRMWGDANGRA